jgi:PmbA protein
VSELLDLAKSALALAKKHGAQDASATLSRAREVELQWRDGKVEKSTEATTRGLSMALYVDGRYTSVSTSDLRPDALDKFVADAIALARTLTKDPHRGLPEPKLYEGRSKLDLQLVDDAEATFSPEARRTIAKQLEAGARSVKGADAIVSVTTGVSSTRFTLARATSNGFEGEREETSFGIWSDVTTKDADGRRPEDWSSASARHLGNLPAIETIGVDAAERALAARGSKKGESATTTIVVENRAARRLLAALLGPMSARALQQQQSFLDGQLGKPIGSKLLTLTDDPLIVRGLGSRLFDGEGLAAKKLPIIKDGVLASYFIDVYYGRKLGKPATTAGPSNLVIPPGKKSLDALLADAKDAIFVTGFLGGNSNGTTGDYSLGIQGFRVRNGKKAEPIAEMNVSGNQRDLWKKLVAVGNDPFAWSSQRTPTLVFEGVSVAGT